MNEKRILLVEDNDQIMKGNQRMLIRRGYEVVTALTLAEAQSTIDEQMPDLIVLDIMLPDGNGLQFMKKLRKYSQVPILLLTGLTGAGNIVSGLSQGGDDYLPKPYDFDVLLARIEALLRRSEIVPDKLVRGKLVLDITIDVATLNGKNLFLTQKEFSLLMIFIQNENSFIDADYLYEKVWQAPMGGDTQSLKKTVHRLREKISGSGWYIEWSRGEGYSFIKE